MKYLVITPVSLAEGEDVYEALCQLDGALACYNLGPLRSIGVSRQALALLRSERSALIESASPRVKAKAGDALILALPSGPCLVHEADEPKWTLTQVLLP